MLEEKSGIKDYLRELAEGIILVLWIIASEASNLSSNITLTGSLVILGILSAYLILQRRAADKSNLAVLKAKLQSEEIKTFAEKVQAPSSLKSYEYELRHDTLNRVIRMLEDTLKDETLPKNVRETYAEVIRRVKDMARAYSPFGA